MNHEVALFTYLLLLDVAVLVLVALKPWSRLLCGAFLGTVFFFASWSFQYYKDSEFGDDGVFPGGILFDFCVGAAAGAAARGW